MRLRLNPTGLEVGDPIAYSPVGPGKITGITDAGYPQVNHVAVSVLVRVDGAVFNPTGTDLERVKQASLANYPDRKPDYSDHPEANIRLATVDGKEVR
jgi:hypothetical protein